MPPPETIPSRPHISPTRHTVNPFRKALTLLILPGMMPAAPADVTLSGITYAQNFDGLAGGLPAGWGITKSATPTSLGSTTFITYEPNPTAWEAKVTGSAKKEAPSDNWRNISGCNLAPGASASQQAANPNRALGWRPGASTTRSGAVTFALKNTRGFKDFRLSVTLFCPFDGSAKLNQTYVVEYSVGQSPDFIPVGPVYETGKVFGTVTITVEPAQLKAIDHQPGPVCFRIRGSSVSGTSKSGLDTLGIDDFILTYVPATR